MKLAVVRLLSVALLVCGVACAAAALALKHGETYTRGKVALSAGESVEIGEDLLLLTRFSVPKYPSGKPRQFVSEVVIIPGEATVGDGRQETASVLQQELHNATISVNHPLRWKDLWIYQSSYDAETEAVTVLEAVRDRWLWLAVLAGALLLAGALSCCRTLAVNNLPAGKEQQAYNSKKMRFLRLLAALLVAAVPLFIIARAVFRPEPIPALQSPLMAPHVAAYAASYLIMLFAAFGLLKRLLPLGFLLMTLGLVLGAVWGKTCWGDWWQYDPKELWGFFTWLVYAVYFAIFSNAGRTASVQQQGDANTCCGMLAVDGDWRPWLERALRLLGAVMVVLTATWVNFSRLFSGLHSYAD